MADDTVTAARRRLDVIEQFTAQTSDELSMLVFVSKLDALIAAVRAESRLTVVKLRDDEASPVAAPCAIEGACQYNAVRIVNRKMR